MTKATGILRRSPARRTALERTRWQEKPIALMGALGLLGSLSYGCGPRGAGGPVSAVSPARSAAQTSTSPGVIPFAFEPNRGQTDPRVRFLARGGGFTLFLTDTEAVVELGPRSWEGQKPTVLRIEFLRAGSKPHVLGRDEQPGKVHVYLGRDPAQWTTNVPRYGKVVYEDLYPGIDVVFHASRSRPGLFEYDFIVSPGADPEQISLGFVVEPEADESSARVRIDEAGNLVLPSPAGPIIQPPPVVYQQKGSEREQRRGGFVLRGPNTAGFHIDDHDGGIALVIDPVVVYSTYLGGSLSDSGRAIAVDSEGSAYITGFTGSPDFPTRQPAMGYSSNMDAFVAKLSPEGNSLVWATYLGGEGDNDLGLAIAVDERANTYVAGLTNSGDFPVTEDAFQPLSNGGEVDCFVAGFNPDGTLSHATYLGGSGLELAADLTLDADGSSVVIGRTNSLDFPLANALQPSYGGGDSDAFLTKLNPSVSELLYSTYFGGSDADGGSAARIVPNGELVFAGSTVSEDFPTVRAFQPARAGGSDIFLTQLSAAGDELVFSTYFGGTGGDGVSPSALAVDANRHIYVAGATSSEDFPTHNAFQPSFGGRPSDAFITKFTPDAQALVYSTYLGGAGGIFTEAASGIAVDGEGNAVVTGDITSPDFPLVNPLQQPRGGVTEVFVARFDPTGDLLFSTYFGGFLGEGARGVAVDALGNAYVTGEVRSPDFPLRNPIPGQPWDESAFVSKFSFDTEEEPCAFVTLFDSGTLFVIDVPVHQVTGSRRLAPRFNALADIAFTPDGSRAYVANTGPFAITLDEPGGGAGMDRIFGEVIVVDTATRDVVERIPLPEPLSIAISPDGGTAYVVGTEALFVMDTATNEVIDEAALHSATHLALTPDGSRIYVAEPLLDLVSIFDAGSLEAETAIVAPAGSRPSRIAFTPDGASAFVSLRNFQSVAVIDTEANEVVDLIPVGLHPNNLSMCPDGSLLYVVHEGFSFGGQVPTEPIDGPFGLVTVIDVQGRSVVERISLEKVAMDVAITPDSAFAYVTDAGGRVILIETATQRIVDIFNLSEERIPIGGPIEIGNLPGGCELRPTCPGDCNRDGVVSIDELIRSVNVALGKNPVDTCAAADADANGSVTVEELVAIVDRSLNGCG